VSPLAASVLAAGELICEFQDGYQRSLLADLAGEPRKSMMLVYEKISHDAAEVVSTRSPGRKPVRVRVEGKAVHFIQDAGPSVMVTTITRCERFKRRNGERICARFTARHAWHFDALVERDPDLSFERQPTGASSGTCEPWRLD
jgi:hypothetical protein